MSTAITEVVDSGVLISKELLHGTDNTLGTCDSQHYIEGSRSKQIFDTEFDKEGFEAKLLNKCSREGGAEGHCLAVFNWFEIFKDDSKVARSTTNLNIFAQVNCRASDEEWDSKF